MRSRLVGRMALNLRTPETLVLYRKRAAGIAAEAAGERGAARFRYSRLKEAAGLRYGF